MSHHVHPKRVRKINNLENRTGPVVYWMSRDQRVKDNWALLYGQELAHQTNQPLVVVFCLVSEFLGATLRQYGFMIKGLKELERTLQQLNIPFFLLNGVPPQQIGDFAKEIRAGSVITDFDPLRIKQGWKKELSKSLQCAFYEVDTHNIVPCFITSQKAEYSARTIRPKINKLLPDFLSDFPSVTPQSKSWSPGLTPPDWGHVFESLQVDASVGEVDWIKPGEQAAYDAMHHFILTKLDDYSTNRNIPNLDGQSNLSPYFHFGQLSTQRIAWEVMRMANPSPSTESFLDELIVRRELSDNFCYFNENYDFFEGFAGWAQKTLNKHRNDVRPFLYSLADFEQAKTHDALWNACQIQMVRSGKMHGYLRMYWAKKILEWTASPEEALQIAIFLNDKYELDGRDPNGYAGIAWSIGGVHDRPWFERPIFGLIRFMSLNGCKSKFDVDSYIASFKA